MNDDYNINNEDELDENLNQENIPAIDGQIGIEELFVRQEEKAEDDNIYIPPMDNQISLDDFVINNDVLKDKDELLNKDSLGIFNNKRTEKLDDFFKEETNESDNGVDDTYSNKNLSNSNYDNAKNYVENNNTNLNKKDDLLEEDDYSSPQNISKSLSNFYGSEEDILQDNYDISSEDNVSINDLIGSETSQDNDNSNILEEKYENAKLSKKGAFSGLNEGNANSESKNYDIIDKSKINSNDTEKEEGLSILEDNNDFNNNNFNNENNQNHNNDNSGNFDNNNNLNGSDDYNDESYQNDENKTQSYDDLSEYNADQNNINQNSFNDENNNINANDINVYNNQENDENQNIEYNDTNKNSNESDINVDDNINNNNDNNDDSINNFFPDETYGGNASSDDTMFSFDGNSSSNETVDYKEDIDNVDNNSDGLDENKNDIDNVNSNSLDNQNDNNDDNDINDNNDDNDTNNDTIDDIDNDGIVVDDNSQVNESVENGVDDDDNDSMYQENQTEDSDEANNSGDNNSVKLVEKQVRANTSKENYFENEENSKIIEDVDAINKDYEEVNVVVGKDAFADYADSTLETGSIQETDVDDISEKVYSENDGQDVVDGMLYKNLDTVLHESMIPYSEHVILDRALPRVEDGLKPVQRRILYSMLELGVTPDKPFRKSARIVGDCLGKYHPHGDSSVYDAMVRMAQPFNTNMLLVSGHGNFGSVDGDGAAAMRYTEARLAPISMELLRDLDKNTVKWCLNFDDTLKEPEILPGRFPNLLVNGATGIAVGLATNIPPHNLAETIDGVVAYLNNPSIKLKEMLKIIKGPDFPTGGFILNTSELYQAYETGRGKIYMRAKMHIESNGADKRYIVITELPYQVNKSSLLQKIANYKDEDKYGLGGISEVRDESDREGLRAVIRLKKDADIKAIYKSLLKNTELQTTFGINMVAIANGKPKQMGLLDIISYYAEYQREIIYRRSKYELEQAKEREHILSGLIIAIKNIDAVVKIIKTSQNTTEAKKRLKEKFNLSDRQAQAILDMRLAKLTSLEVYKLEEELKRLRELIKKLTAIIASKKLQKDIVKDEMLQIKRQYKQERKTKFAKLEEDIGTAPEPKEEANQKVVILKSVQNNFKCVTLKQYNYAQKDVTDNSTLFDTHILKYETATNNTLIAFSSLGNCFKVDVKDFTLSRYRDKGVPEQSIFKELSTNERIVALFDINLTSKEGNFIFLTKYGMIKKTAYTEYSLLKKYYQGMKLKDDDEIVSVCEEPKNNYTYIFVTKQGMVLNAENTDVPLQGRISGGVKGINLANNDYCVGVGLAGDGGEILAVTNKGFTKRVLISNVDKSARYRKGLKFFTFTGDNGRELIFASVVTNPFTLGCVDNEDNLHYRSTDHIPIESRTGKGKAVDRMKKSLNILKAFAVNN